MKFDRNSLSGNDGEKVILPPGEYEFKVIKATYKKSKSSGKPMWEVSFAFPGFENAYATDYFMEDSPKKFVQFYDCIGLNSDDTDDMNEKNTFGATGKCRVYTRHDDQYGDSNRIGKYIKAEGFEATVTSEDLPF